MSVAAGASARLSFSTQTERYHTAIAAARREARLLLDLPEGLASGLEDGCDIDHQSRRLRMTQASRNVWRPL
jgi:hypothetical protein